jgi:hypothetical protein
MLTSPTIKRKITTQKIENPKPPNTFENFNEPKQEEKVLEDKQLTETKGSTDLNNNNSAGYGSGTKGNDMAAINKDSKINWFNKMNRWPWGWRLVIIIILSVFIFLCIKPCFDNELWIPFFISVFFDSWLLGEFFKALRKRGKYIFDGIDALPSSWGLVTIIALIVSLIGLIQGDIDIITQIALEFRKNEIRIDESKINSKYRYDENYPVLIFAFDNSQRGLIDSLPSELKQKNVNYLTKVQKYLPHHNTLPQENTYGAFLKLKLCNDLIEIYEIFEKAKINADFYIMMIGNNDLEWNKEIERLALLNEDNIRNSVRRVLVDSGITDHKESNFLKFYDDLKRNIIRDTPDPKYTIYIYSDFYHDIGTTDNPDIKEILKHRKNFANSQVRQNFFLDSHNPSRQNKGESYILDNKPQKNERIFPINSEDWESSAPIRIADIEDDLYWNYRDSNKVNINIRLDFSLPDQYCKIRLLKSLEGEGEFKIENMNEKLVVNEWHNLDPVKDTIVTITYYGRKTNISEEENVEFEIVHNKFHYIVPVGFNKLWDFPGWFVCGLIALAGFLIGFLYSKKNATMNI